MTQLEVKEENGQKYVEGVGSGWVLKGREFVVLAASEQELSEVLAWFPGGEDCDPLFFRNLRVVDRGRLYPMPDPALHQDEAHARVLSDSKVQED